MKRILTIVLACIFMITFAVPVYGTAASSGSSSGDFSDVSKEHWAYDAINWMVDNHIVEGTGGNQFLPAKEVSRDEYAKMMVLTLNLKLINPSRESFLDIKKGGWQFKYAETAKPYMTGFRTATGDYFRPSDTAVREDMAVALVKALGFSDETADLTLLSQFSDEAKISPNLKKYVAIAIKHKLMEGYDKDGKRIFAPDEGLNRASAAILLYNAFRENEEKITFDDEKVTYDDEKEINSDDDDEDEDEDEDEDNSAGNNLTPSNVKVSISGDKAIVSWDKITSSNFSGYKVVLSQSDSSPVYPDNGYLSYITDRNNNSIVVRAGDSYNGGDIGGRLKSGVNYYFSVTVLYNNGKAAGNVVKAKLPSTQTVEESENDSSLTPSKIRVSISGDKALVSWDKITSSKFSGYKLVISRYDSTPVYPDNGYSHYITDRNNNSVVIKAGDGYSGGDIEGGLKSGVYYYFSVTVLYNDSKAAGNVVRAKLP